MKNFKLGRNLAAVAAVLTLMLVSRDLYAQGEAKPAPDVVIFPNGEKLIGHFESFTGGSAKFKSDTLGEVTVDLSKVQELHTSQKFAVVRKDVKLETKKVDDKIPQGTISVANQKVDIEPGNGQTAQSVPVGDINTIIDVPTFQAALRRPGIFEKWKGAIVFGSSIVEATQNSLSFNTSTSLVRAIPSVDWLSPRNRTTLDFSDSYGKVTQPSTPTVKTSIYHADAERDEYFTSRFYALGAVAFDHNFSQGLDLQQTYGGGIGVTVIQAAKQTLDLKASVDYQKQTFEAPAQNQNLADSLLDETYTATFFHGVALKEQLTASPAWTNTKAYSTFSSVGLTFPVYKRFGFSANVIDSFLNNPPPGFKKNSIQFATGLSYTLP